MIARTLLMFGFTVLLFGFVMADPEPYDYDIQLLTDIADGLTEECEFDCVQCFSPMGSHRVDLVGPERGDAIGPHEEPCNTFGSCDDHDCDGSENEEEEEDLALLLDALEGMPAQAVFEVVAASPASFELDSQHRALLVRSCREDQYVARLPMPEATFELLRTLE